MELSGLLSNSQTMADSNKASQKTGSGPASVALRDERDKTKIAASAASLTLEALDYAEEAAIKEAASIPAATSLPPLTACLMDGCWANILDPQY